MTLLYSAGKTGESYFLSKLAYQYTLAPSMVLIRTAEAELLSALPMEPPILDLCCGDGYFASLIRPEGFEAGCDLSESALKRAIKRGIYKCLACADVTKGIPFPDACFSTVVSNSSLEHVNDIDATLREIARVLKPGGRLYTTFASHYAYEWWPCGKSALSRYLSFQPVYNYFSLQEWERRMVAAGLHVLAHQYYLSKNVTRVFLWLDYHFSHVYLTSDRTLARFFVRGLHFVPKRVLARLWRLLFSRIRICPDGAGGGILIIAERIKCNSE